MESKSYDIIFILPVILETYTFDPWNILKSMFFNIGFEVPTSCPNVPSEVLQPRTTWSDKTAYDATADKLANMFNENFERYARGVSDAVNQAAPKAV